jgi:hypothetical protein
LTKNSGNKRRLKLIIEMPQVVGIGRWEVSLREKEAETKEIITTVAKKKGKFLKK